MFTGKSIRTDLTLEAHELIGEKAIREDSSRGLNMPGVEMENAGDNNIKITRVRVTSPTGEVAIGKPMGNYITLEVPGLRDNDQALYENTCKAFAKELAAESGYLLSQEHVPSRVVLLCRDEKTREGRRINVTR